MLKGVHVSFFNYYHHYLILEPKGCHLKFFIYYHHHLILGSKGWPFEVLYLLLPPCRPCHTLLVHASCVNITAATTFYPPPPLPAYQHLSSTGKIYHFVLIALFTVQLNFVHTQLAHNPVSGTLIIYI